MRICIVPTMFPKYKGDYYGSFVFDDARELVKNGFEVHVITQHNHGIPYDEMMEGVNVHRFKWFEPPEFKALVHFHGLIDNLRLITYIISLFFNLIWITKKYDVDIIHAHSVIPTGLVAVILSRIIRKPVFITVHGMDVTNFEKNRIYKRIISFSLKNCKKSIAVSEYLFNSIISFGTNRDNTTILRNAVDQKRFRPYRNKKLRLKYKINNGNIVILFVGYLDDFKGIFELVEAFFEISINNKNLNLIIVGTGPKEDQLKMKVVNLGLEKSVIFTNQIPPSEIHEYYQTADIFVLPSYTDAGGPPLVFIEAMACGLPVIGTDVGGIPEGIENGINGFIIPAKNVNELARKLNILSEDENLRKEFGNNSLKKIQENSMTLEMKTEKLIDFYNSEIKNL